AISVSATGTTAVGNGAIPLQDKIENGDEDDENNDGGIGKDGDDKNPNNPQIEQGKQDKHIEGSNNYDPTRSTLTADPNELAQKAGTGKPINDIPLGQAGSKERVNFEKNIGNFYDRSTGQSIPTTVGIIHYSKKGIHIVPARPNS
ncbi:MAG: Hemagglutinin/adhesin repeat protein, partial [uncultured bacterium]